MLEGLAIGRSSETTGEAWDENVSGQIYFIKQTAQPKVFVLLELKFSKMKRLTRSVHFDIRIFRFIFLNFPGEGIRCIPSEH